MIGYDPTLHRKDPMLKVTDHLTDGQEFPEVRVVCDESGQLVAYDVTTQDSTTHIALQRTPQGSGFTIESLIAMAAHRLKYLNDQLPSAWNEAALEKLRRALADLHDRTHDRRQRGVEGSHAS